MESPKPEGSEISLEGRAWHIAFADAIASRDAARYVSFMHENCSVQINNAMPVYSKLAISKAYTAYLGLFREASYELLNVFGDKRQSVTEALFTYICHDGTSQVVQHSYVLDRDDQGLITSVRVYGDHSRILKPFMAAND